MYEWLKSHWDKEKDGMAFTISWANLRETVKLALEDKPIPWVNNPTNRQTILRHTAKVQTGFHGYTRDQLYGWVTRGFQSDLLSGISDVLPAREKRRYVFMEEGEEILVDRALSGEDNYEAAWTKRQVIPGASIVAEVMFSGSVSSRIVNAYNVWICKAISSLESAGIDTQILYRFTSTNIYGYSARNSYAEVRVKQENEDLDFNSFSPMLSPATLRTFGFCALTLACEADGKSITSSVGNGRRGASNWSVKYNKETDQILIDCPYDPYSFDEGSMDSQFKIALAEMSGSS